MKKIMFSVGEPSGEILACEVIKRIQENKSSITFNGMGGKYMRSLGVNILVDSSNISIIGFIEALKKWRILKQYLEILKTEIKHNPPNLLVLVDYVEFNLRLGEFAKKMGSLFCFTSALKYGHGVLNEFLE